MDFLPSSYLNFKNVVIALGVLTVLVFVGSVVSGEAAFFLSVLLAIMGLILYEMRARRAWESALMERLQRMSDDYDRLVRETARSRNDIAALKKSLVDVGMVARKHGREAGDHVEERMIRSIVEQLSKMGDVEPEAIEEAEQAAVPVRPAPTSAEESLIGSPLSDEQVLQIVRAAVKQDRIDLFMQPVVNLPQRKLRFYEMLSRIRIKPDVYLPAERYIQVAMEQDLVPVIDNLLLLRSLQVLRDTEEDDFNRAYFCNITSLTLNDPKFMADLVEFISQNKTLAPRLVFEMGQRDLATMDADVLPILDGLSKLGCRFSMDQVRSVSFDFEFLAARHIRFIKVEAELLLRELAQPAGLNHLIRVKGELDRSGIDLIAEKIETEKELVELLDVEIDYGQGYLFGKPALYDKP